MVIKQTEKNTPSWELNHGASTFRAKSLLRHKSINYTLMNVTSIYNLPDNSWYAENENKAQYVGVYIYNVRRHVDGSSYFNRMTLQLHACITWEYW